MVPLAEKRSFGGKEARKIKLYGIVQGVDPPNRRFHSQPNACPECGLQIKVVDSEGKKCTKDSPELLKNGVIVKVKSLGGFHLACNALDKKAVLHLRTRKIRDSKNPS